MKTETQNSLIGKVVAFLNANGYVAWRQENSGRFDAQAAADVLTKLVLALRAMPNYDAKKIRAAVTGKLATCWRKIPDSARGVSDVIGWHIGTGRWIAVEVKIGTDALRLEQIDWLASLRRAGGAVYMVRDFDSFEAGFWRDTGKKTIEI